MAEPLNTAAGYAGRRRHLPAVLHAASAGASMPLTRHPEVSHAVDFNVCFVPVADVKVTAAKGVQRTY